MSTLGCFRILLPALVNVGILVLDALSSGGNYFHFVRFFLSSRLKRIIFSALCTAALFMLHEQYFLMVMCLRWCPCHFPCNSKALLVMVQVSIAFLTVLGSEAASSDDAWVRSRVTPLLGDLVGISEILWLACHTVFEAVLLSCRVEIRAHG